MKKISIIILGILFFACNNKQKQTYLIPDSTEINDIVKTIVYNDSLPVIKIPADTVFGKNGSYYINNTFSFPLNIELRKLRAIPIDSVIASEMIIDNNSSIDINQLLNEKIDNLVFFEKTDSSFFRFQNDTLLHFFIDNKELNNINFTSTAEQIIKIQATRYAIFYDITIPIFSADLGKAYVEVKLNRPFLGGYKYGIYLKKINNKWTIVGKKEISIS